MAANNRKMKYCLTYICLVGLDYKRVQSINEYVSFDL